MTRRIPLRGVHGKGRYVLVDDADYEALVGFSWHLSNPNRTHRYAVHTFTERMPDGSRRTKQLAMHRQILEAPPGLKVDHIDGNTLNNTRKNLRLATDAQNSQNNGGSSRSVSRFKGVGWHAGIGRWQAQIGHEGKVLYMGLFKNEIEAAKVYDQKARELFGDFARLNFPEEGL